MEILINYLFGAFPEYILNWRVCACHFKSQGYENIYCCVSTDFISLLEHVKSEAESFIREKDFQYII